LAQDDYFYEIQLSNKQLVFYFMAGATGLILSFLAGVMVGRGVDQAGTEVRAARPVQEDRLVTEEPPRPPSPVTQDLSYAQRLEGEKVEDVLEKPKPVASTAAPKPSPRVAATPMAPRPSPSTVVASRPVALPSAAAGPPRPTTGASASRPAGPGATGTFALQVGAFKDKASAEAVVSRLKSKGFAAYAVTPEGEGLFNVRVGHFAGRADAERVQARLRDQEKFQPFIVKN